MQPNLSYQHFSRYFF